MSTQTMLMQELVAAHRIIRNALQIMTPAQKLAWGEANARDGVDGDGVTRANEREAVIVKANGDSGSACNCQGGCRHA